MEPMPQQDGGREGGTEFGLVFTSAQRVLFSLCIQLNMSGNKPGTTLVLVDGL